MRIIKIIAFTILTLLLLSAVIGYFYFEEKFTPPENQLSISSDEDTIAIEWVSNQDSKIAAMLIPVKLEGIPDTFYMQFDLGSHSTLFYEKSLQSISEKYSVFKHQYMSDKTPLNFKIGTISVSANYVRRIDYGSGINWNNSVNIIGTLGADILEHKVVAFNFKHHFIHFHNVFPNDVASRAIQDFQFKKRKVLLNAMVDDDNTQLYYDSGSSAFELITSKKRWKKLAHVDAVERTSYTNSWGKSLAVHSIKSNGVIKFGDTSIPLDDVTYIEGTSLVQNLLMYLGGMGGMIGNKIFMDKTLILDARNQKMAVF